MSVPRNLVSPALTGSLDRTKTSGRSAMRNLSAVVSTFTTPDGDKVGLDSFVLSRSSIERGRQNGRQLISLQAKLEFLENLPEHLACHWDGKMIEDLLGILNEAEAIVASGRNGKYKEGKLLDIVDLIDKEGKKTFTGEAQEKLCMPASRSGVSWTGSEPLFLIRPPATVPVSEMTRTWVPI